MTAPTFPVIADPLATNNLPVYTIHKSSIGHSRSLWWPCRETAADPTVVLLFIAGNPGLVSFYQPFLTTIHEDYPSDSLAIFAHGHVGHSREEYTSHHAISLTGQRQHALEILDNIKKQYPESKVVLLGHSVGSWIAFQLLKLRPEACDRLFLLFPTIMHIRQTPNGRRLWPLFPYPVPRILSSMSPITQYIPSALWSRILGAWPDHQLKVVKGFASSPSSIYASLTMAGHEMTTIRDLDVDLLTSNKDRIWMYFAEEDEWVGEHKDTISKVFDDRQSVRVVHGHRDIPHAFCINHGEQVAAQCLQWLEAI